MNNIIVIKDINYKIGIYVSLYLVLQLYIIKASPEQKIFSAPGLYFL